MTKQEYRELAERQTKLINELRMDIVAARMGLFESQPVWADSQLQKAQLRIEELNEPKEH